MKVRSKNEITDSDKAASDSLFSELLAVINNPKHAGIGVMLMSNLALDSDDVKATEMEVGDLHVFIAQDCSAPRPFEINGQELTGDWIGSVVDGKPVPEITK